MVRHSEERTCFLPKRIVIAMMTLTYLGTHLAFGNKDISFCKERLGELKKDVKNWKERCLNKKGNELVTSQCHEEEQYNQKRMKIYKKTCFYDGNLFY